MKIGVLALQGGFAEHAAMIRRVGASAAEIRNCSDLGPSGLSGLILPGGESTTISRLLQQTGLFEPVRQLIVSGMPVLGTCAGLILLAAKIDDSRVKSFQSIDITVKRNIYGRQLGSFQTLAVFADIGQIPMTFIRAPGIDAVGPDVTALASVDGRTVAARQGNVLVTAFHPELTSSPAVHQYFLDMCQSSCLAIGMPSAG